MTYEQALAEAAEVGLSRCSDAAAMAAFCESDLPHILGAVGPRLVWEGAQRQGLKYKELVTLCIREPGEAEALQWEKERPTMTISTTGHPRVDQATAEIAVALRDASPGRREQTYYDEAARLRNEILSGTGVCGDCGDDLAASPGPDGNLTHLADGTRACRSRAEANARRDWQGRPRVGHRPLRDIGEETITDWAAPGREPYFGAVPYIEALRHLDGIGTMYGQEHADDIVRYFLVNAKTWRGDTARRIKAELRSMLEVQN